ncbi:MAG: hypothetical protein LBF88_00985 [Planctomycetaceae bacterium]|jgi:hypothetical protein|nr:hypothetical protein [Planctomycetaceae bacterium]
MTLTRFVLCCVLLVILSPTLWAQQPSSEVLATGSGRVVWFAPNFSVKWEYPAGNIHDVQLLKNGNILFADSNVIEITPDKKIVFQYTPPNGKEGSFACQRLDNGNTLIGENFSGQVKEIASDSTVKFTLQTKFSTDNQHHRMRWVRKLSNGNYLVCHSGDHLVREYASTRRTVKPFGNKKLPISRLPLNVWKMGTR